MTKHRITFWWLIGAAVVIVGGLIALFSSLDLVAHIQYLTDNYRLNTFVPDTFFWVLVSLIILGGIAAVGGFVLQFVAWIGAVINTSRLANRTWFNVLLWCGIAGLVLGTVYGLGILLWWGVMIAYLGNGPDGTAVEPMLLRATPSEPPMRLAPTG
jgi:hypothetical protein